MNPTLSSAHTKRLNGHGEEAVSPTTASLRWDTEVLVVRGDDRADLRQRMRVLADFLTRTPTVELKDVAFTLNATLAPGGSRLAVVADSVADLQARLVRAAERLDDPSCRHIKDTRGCYFFEEPLHPQGKLALLFPGEGGQYLNMLRDLIPHFPEVRAHFEESDRLSTKYGRPRPISTAILIDDDAPAARTAAERELWCLNNAIASILLADWALYQLLLNLGIQPDAIASHSAGEFLALSAAGSLEHDDDLLGKLFTLGEVLRRQEDDGAMKFALLAVGTNRQAVSAVIAQFGVEVHIAMDNCPHQTVLGGSAPAIAAVEAELKSRGVVCERLPFNRPYHTPLFEPFLAPVARTYESLPVRTARTPTYSCITGQLLPDDPDEIRRLGVEHWARPVEFVRMIENMHADGVRLFVECGPRGNLTSFVQDILRGRSFEAVASNLAQRSGLSQLNHMAALLEAHHVPLRFEHFYSRRSPRPVAWEANPVGWVEAQEAHHAPGGSRRASAHPTPPMPTAPPDGNRAVVMQQYFGVMEQFLDMEREVMEQFLARRRGVPAARPSVRPLLGEIVRHEPARELVLRRRMDLSEDLYASDHTLGARDASAVDPTQHGLPFMPMAFSVEMMAEAAAFLLPGQLVVGLKRVRLQRWIPFDDEAITLELTARICPEEPNAVAVEIRDLGNVVMPGNADTPAVVGTVLLGTHYPEPPPPEVFPLTHESSCGFTAHQLYAGERRLFHGPLFEALESTDRQGDEGIEGHLRTLPHSGLFHSTPEPDLILDPLLIDASTHLLGSWHLSQPDQNGRVVLPYELGSVTLYGPRPATGTRIKCRVRVENGSARQVSHRIDLIGPDDRLWCRLAPAEYWRFYWPLEYVDFFRFKERFLLAKDWHVCLASAKQTGRCLRLDPPSDLCQPVHRMALARVTCSHSERQTFRLLKIPDSQLTDWLFGRIAAKDAIRSLWLERHGQRLFPADVEIGAGPHGRTLARYRGGALPEGLPTVSFAHAPGVSAALVAFVPYVGIALQRLAGKNMAGIESLFDATERALLDVFGPERAEWSERFRCARAAVANALGSTLADDPREIVVRKAERGTGRILVALGPRLVEAYPEFRLDLLAVHTVRDGDLIAATTFCERDRL